MTTIQTFSEAQQDLAALLDHAIRDGGVRIQRADGSTFILRPEGGANSPLDVPGVDLGVSTEEIIACIRTGRERA
jgi:hypothetical protein